MAGITYSPIEFVGTYFEEIFMEVLFQNETVSQNKVRLITDIKAQTIITEMDVDVTLQAYICGSPTPAGSIDINDAVLSPCKQMSYNEFCPDDLRFSRFSTQMRAGAWEVMPEDWLRVVMETYGTKTSRLIEQDFWNGASAATKAAVALLPVGPNLTAEEKAYVAAAPLTLCDGITTYLIYNRGAVGTSIDVVGVPITATNIWDEYKRVYSAIPIVLLQSSNINDLRIFAPESHMQMINIYNTDQLYRDKFSMDAAGNWYFLGVRIMFVPLAANVMTAGRWSDYLMGTDLTSDFSYVKVDVVTNNADTRFIEQVFTMSSAVTVQTQKVNYVG
jgi:hypothetical protein